MFEANQVLIMALAMTSRRPAISAESGIKWRSAREGAIKLCRHNERRNGEDLRRILKILLIQSQAQFSDPSAQKLLPEFSQISLFKRNSPSAQDPVESVYRQSESESPELAVYQELWSTGEKEYEPCVPPLSWPDPVHKCSQIPCPVCRKR